MEKEQKLFLLKPAVFKKIWGSERWLLSTMQGASSFYYDKNEISSVNSIFCKPFPILIKIIEANETLSVQVHPGDEYALENENSVGKTECWYVLYAKPNSVIVTGFKNNLSKEEIYLSIKENRIESYLAEFPVEKGDLIFIPAGTVHAIKGGLKLLEIQQASDITYRLYDWGRNRELHIEKALNVIKNCFSEPIKSFSGIFKCDYFSIEKQEVNGIQSINIPNDWIFLFIIDGSGSIKCDSEKIKVTKDSAILIAPNAKIQISGKVSFLKIYSK